MIQTKSVQPLMNIGLNKYEAKVYLVLVGEGISTAKNISDISGIPYGKVYEIIGSLAVKGFAIIFPSKPMKCQAISPKEAITMSREKMNEKYDNDGEHIIKELGEMFEKSKNFEVSKGFLFTLVGRTNIEKKINELILEAKNHIYFFCSSNTLSRLVVHKELLYQRKDEIDIKILAVNGDKELFEEAKTFSEFNVRKTKTSHNFLISIDGKTCLIVEPIPDDRDVVFGRDHGVLIQNESTTMFMEDFFIFMFNKSREYFQ